MDKENQSCRKDRIAAYLREYTAAHLSDDTIQDFGLDASGVALHLSLDRANASRDLNALYRDGLAIKLLGKPTRYLHYQAVAERFSEQYIPNTIPIGQRLRDYTAGEAPSAAEGAPAAQKAALADDRYPSLYLSAIQAESAVNYPPHGLHTLLTGPYGSGKYLFAKQMFAYGKAIGKFDSDAKFYVFDTHGFLNSAQALIIQLFGCTAGVTSPSAPGRKGLVERAEGGVLLLMDVQALPLPAREKLIDLMMYGTFTRYGEAAVNRQCKVMLIATCNESSPDPRGDSLLKYFPMRIALPPLAQRTVSERFLYLYQSFQAEAAALDCEFHVSRDVFYQLLCTTASGDFIRLRGDIKSVCSIACRECLTATRGRAFRVEYRHLPSSVLACPADSPDAADFQAVLSRYPQEGIVIHANSIPLTPAAPERDALPQKSGGLPIEAPGILFIKNYLDEYLRSASECGEEFPGRNQLMAGQIVRRLRADPVLGALEERDPYIQGLAALIAETAHANINCRFLQLPDEAALLAKVPPALRETAVSLEGDVCRLSASGTSTHRVSLISLYLCLLHHRLTASPLHLFFLFRGKGVGAGLAAYAAKRYPCPVTPIPFEEDGTSASLLAKIDEAVAALPANAQVLLFSDGPPFDDLHDYIARRHGLAAKTVSGATLETILQTARNVVRFHYTLEMIDCRPARTPAPPQAEPTVSIVPQAIQSVLVPSLSFLDIGRVSPLLEDSLAQINRQLKLNGSDNSSIRYQFHCAHMIERLIRKEPLDYPHLKSFLNAHSRQFRVIGEALTPIAQTFGVKIPTNEIAYLVELFLSV